MKRYYFTLIIVLILFSCEKSNQNLLEYPQTKVGIISKNLDDLDIPIGEENAYNLAKLLSKHLHDKSFISKVQSESKKQFDGDYDILLAKALSKSTPNLSAFKIGHTNNGFLYDILVGRKSQTEIEQTMSYKYDLDSLINSILSTDPLLNIYMPDWGNDLSKHTDFLIVIDKKDINDSEEYFVNAINNKGEVLRLSSKEEPQVPYMVIGYNERLEAIIQGEESIDDKDIVFETATHKYYIEAEHLMPDKDEHGGGGVGNSGSSGSVSKKRSVFDRDSYEVITEASFTSIKAIKAVEGWLRGRPEVLCKVYYQGYNLKDFIIGEASVKDVYIGKEDWYSGRRFWGTASVEVNKGNWVIMRWVPTAAITKMCYLFYENDGGVTIKLNPTSKTEINVSIEKGDLIGSDWVFFTDDLGKKYKISNLFWFKIDQKK